MRLTQQQINNLSIQQLQTLEEALNSFLFKQKGGEPFDDSYRSNPKLFKKLTKQMHSFEKDVFSYFKDQQARLFRLVRLPVTIHADDQTDGYMNEDGWDYETTELSKTVYFNIENAFNLGVAAAHHEMNLESTISSQSAPQQKFLREYSLKLAKDINQTTQDRIKEQIATSIAQHETRDQMTSRINDILDNQYRSQMIAQTESVRAFTQAKLAVGSDVGANFKEWLGPQADDSICGEANGEEVGIDESFSNGEDGPPAHPNCRCGLRLFYKSENGDKEQEVDEE